jgi:hypothetical protein
MGSLWRPIVLVLIVGIHFLSGGRQTLLAIPSASAGVKGHTAEQDAGTHQETSRDNKREIQVPTDAEPEFVPRGVLRQEIIRLAERPVFRFRDTAGVLPEEMKPLQEDLAGHIRQWLENEPLAPLVVDIGLAGREIFFAHSGEVIRALSLAIPHLPEPLRKEVISFLDVQWEEHFPLGTQAWYPLGEGKRRERHLWPPNSLENLQPVPGPHPFAHLYAVWCYAFYADRGDRVSKAWPQIYRCWEDFRRTHLPLESRRDALWANGYLAGLIGFLRIAKNLGQQTEISAALDDGEQLGQWCVERFRDGAARLDLPIFENVGQFDRWRAEDMGGFFLPLPPHHKAKPDKFHGLTPEVGQLFVRQAPEAAAAYLKFVDRSLPGWYLVGEERQLHFGENFVDYPDFALSIFQAQAFLGNQPAGQLARWVDIPWCVGDPYFVEKLAICLHVAVVTEEMMQAREPGKY